MGVGRCVAQGGKLRRICVVKRRQAHTPLVCPFPVPPALLLPALLQVEQLQKKMAMPSYQDKTPEEIKAAGALRCAALCVLPLCPCCVRWAEGCCALLHALHRAVWCCIRCAGCSGLPALPVTHHPT